MTTIGFDWATYDRRPEVFRTLRRRVRDSGMLIIRHHGEMQRLKGRRSSLERTDPALVEEFIRRGPDR